MSFNSKTPRVRRPVPAAYRKWTKGEKPIASLEELQSLILRGYYIFDGDRSAGYHPSVINGWQFRTLRQRIKAKLLFPGVRNLNTPYVFEAVWHQAAKGVDPKLSHYIVTCDELGVRFDGKNRNRIVAVCRLRVRMQAGAEGRCEVKFDDNDRP